MNPKISVLIPAYNGEPFISDAIESVLNQDYKAHEIIVIDDGSTDNTPKILEGFKDKVISRRVKNTGSPSIPRNIAMDMATGSYIAFLDQDDLWLKNKLEKQLEFILQYPDIGFFFSDFAVRRMNKKLRMKKHFSLLRFLDQMNFDKPLKINPFKLLLKENFVGGASSVIIKKEIINQVGEFADCLTYTEDYDYWLRCARITNFVAMSQILMYKKTHTTNLSNDRIWHYIRHERTLRKTMQNMSSYIKENGFWGDYRLSLSRNYYNLGNSYFEAGKVKLAFNMYLQGLLTSKDFKNLISFIWRVAKKLIRLLIFNVIGRKYTKRKR
ncbi:MAG: glycosyltransferase family 2 protein [Candidatus Aureabacteria bacterium]|nr:glycosyltransferase family 2 protein [Candidatus Auribacterota bacterium]